ncbi:MAG: hypothetical protein Q7V20_07460 [Aquabacterium sp.]|uniref:hypothetical protein n=1 Tax=Aquabacterium sp. TaxID=1872578 RepID=UPI0027195FC2|nr:hypothetical protein [Aquabacterium sp.]MDO9003271.1 hypothetical protein [Aquabacterium sp.]
MKCDSWSALSMLGVCLAMAACSSAPPSAPTRAMLAPVNPNCGLSAAPNGELGLSCLLTGPLADTQVDAERPGNTACSGDSFSIFKQSVSTPIWLVHGQKGDDGPLRVRVGGSLGPGTHLGKIGKSAGNDCDAIVGPVASLATQYGGTYVAMVDKTQRPACVSQSRLILSAFTQKLSVALPKDLGGVTRESTTDAMQKRLDLEVATQVNQYLQPGQALPDVVVSRHGRCPDGFRTFIGN